MPCDFVEARTRMRNVGRLIAAVKKVQPTSKVTKLTADRTLVGADGRARTGHKAGIVVTTPNAGEWGFEQEPDGTWSVVGDRKAVSAASRYVQDAYDRIPESGMLTEVTA